MGGVNGRKEAQITYLRATAHYQMEEFRDSLKWAIETENLAKAEGKDPKENWIYLQVVLYNELQTLITSSACLNEWWSPGQRSNIGCT